MIVACVLLSCDISYYLYPSPPLAIKYPPPLASSAKYLPPPFESRGIGRKNRTEISNTRAIIAVATAAAGGEVSYFS